MQIEGFTNVFEDFQVNDSSQKYLSIHTKIFTVLYRSKKNSHTNLKGS